MVSHPHPTVSLPVHQPRAGLLYGIHHIQILSTGHNRIQVCVPNGTLFPLQCSHRPWSKVMYYIEQGARWGAARDCIVQVLCFFSDSFGLSLSVCIAFQVFFSLMLQESGLSLMVQCSLSLSLSLSLRTHYRIEWWSCMGLGKIPLILTSCVGVIYCEQRENRYLLTTLSLHCEFSTVCSVLSCLCVESAGCAHRDFQIFLLCVP